MEGNQREQNADKCSHWIKHQHGQNKQQTIKENSDGLGAFDRRRLNRNIHSGHYKTISSSALQVFRHETCLSRPGFIGREKSLKNRDEYFEDNHRQDGREGDGV